MKAKINGMEFEGTIEEIKSIMEHNKKLTQSSGTVVYTNTTGTISPSTFPVPFPTTMNLCSATISEEGKRLLNIK